MEYMTKLQNLFNIKNKPIKCPHISPAQPNPKCVIS